MTMTAELLTTPLHAWHVAHGGRMVEFGGWSMPVQYTSISDEHLATRNAVGLFDISHMGRLQFFGPAAAQFLDTMCTRHIANMKPGQIRYSLVCNKAGGILDDVLVYRLREGDSASRARDEESPTFQVVVNASNRQKIVDWFTSHIPDFAARMADITRATAMIAVQGPRALELAREPFGSDLSAMRYYTGDVGQFVDAECYVSRTGYTGEDGCEIICDQSSAVDIWERLITVAKPYDGGPVGLGARNTLRLEAAMPLYGHELSESTNPFQAGLDFAVNFEGREFIGREALVKFAADKSLPVRVGLQLDGKRVPREGHAVLQGNETVGEVTSGTFSPTFARPIAMAYVKPNAQAVGTRLAVDIRGTQHAAVVVPLPFYERGRS
jgi:aminomethyltransferase